MPTTNIADLQRSANNALKQAMQDERSRRWPQVVQNYRRLLRMLSKENLPANFETPPWFSMLLYECHYHLGLALQHVGEHKKATSQYSRAIQAVFIPKNGCTAGCNTSTCLMTPVYARRAVAYAKTGDYRSALRDAEKGVVLDNQNPDVFCVRALIRSTRLEMKEALKDVKCALKYNPDHLCALILRGGIDQPPSMNVLMGENTATSEEHKQACSINPDCLHYLGVKDVKHPEFIPFYERFLYSLSVPHTISEMYFPQAYTQSTGGSNHSIHSSSSTVSTNPMKFLQTRRWQSGEEGRGGFRCGTHSGSERQQEQEKSVRQRRIDYGRAVREHTTRPRTAAQFIAQLEDHLMKKDQQSISDHNKSIMSAVRPDSWTSKASTGTSSEPPRVQGRRPGTAVVIRRAIRPSSGISVVSCPPSLNCSRPASVKAQNFRSALLNKCTADDSDMASTMSLLSYTTRASSSVPQSRDTTAVSQASSSNNSKNKAMQAFQAGRNIDEAPRMYYRPWSGDKLPVAEVDRKTYLVPAFKV